MLNTCAHCCGSVHLPCRCPASRCPPLTTPLAPSCRHEKVQENCIDLVGRIADRGAEFVPAREWMRICFELLDMLRVRRVGLGGGVGVGFCCLAGCSGACLGAPADGPRWGFAGALVARPACHPDNTFAHELHHTLCWWLAFKSVQCSAAANAGRAATLLPSPRLQAHKKAIRRATVNTFGYIAKAIGPQDVLVTLLNNLKVGCMFIDWASYTAAAKRQGGKGGRHPRRTGQRLAACPARPALQPETCSPHSHTVVGPNAAPTAPRGSLARRCKSARTACAPPWLLPSWRRPAPPSLCCLP